MLRQFLRQRDPEPATILEPPPRSTLLAFHKERASPLPWLSSTTAHANDWATDCRSPQFPDRPAALRMSRTTYRFLASQRQPAPLQYRAKRWPPLRSTHLAASLESLCAPQWTPRPKRPTSLFSLPRVYPSFLHRVRYII